MEMKKRYVRHTLLHLLIRWIAGVNLIETGLEFVYPPFGRVVANGPFILTGFAVAWLVITAISLPVFVVVESQWIQDDEAQRKAVRIDAVFALAWFFVFVISLLYTANHTLWWL
jgi:hypothetical protein